MNEKHVQLREFVISNYKKESRAKKNTVRSPWKRSRCGCRRLLPRLKRQVRILFVFGCMAVISTVFINSGGILMIQHAFLTNNVARHIQQDQSQKHKHRSGMSTVTMTTRQSSQTLNKSSTCAKHIHHTNYTSCPQCFRPATVNVGERITEIGHIDYLIPDKRPGVFTPAEEIVERVITDYLIVPQLKCPYLLAVQPSVLAGRNERDLVRSTWGSVAKTNAWPNRNINAEVKVVFVVGKQAPEESSPLNNLHNNETDVKPLYMEQIESEAGQHNDILFINMVDGYRNLTLKLLSAFKWAKDNCPCVRFVLKVDFDTFVNVPLLVDTLLYSENRLEFSVLGMAYSRSSSVMRSGRWGVPASLYPMAKYPEYVSGCGYVLSIQALSHIVDTVHHYRMFPVEDAFITGVMRRVVGFRLFSLDRMFTHYNDKYWHSCEMFEDGKVLGLTDQPQKHHIIWESFTKGCGYVLSIRTLSHIVDTVPHYRMFAVEDAFITGVMRRVVGFRRFSLFRMFTHHYDKDWDICQMLDDNKVLGVTDQPKTHQIIWDSFVNGDCLKIGT